MDVNMVRTYKRKTSRGIYGEEALQNALRALESGSSLKCASTSCGIPRRTLRRHGDSKVREAGKSLLGRHTPVFSSEIEKEFVMHIQKMERALFGLTTNDVRHLANEFAT